MKASTVERVVVASSGPVPESQLVVPDSSDLTWSVVAFDVAALADDLPEGGPLAVDRASEDLAAAGVLGSCGFSPVSRVCQRVSTPSQESSSHSIYRLGRRELVSRLRGLSKRVDPVLLW